MPITTQCSNTWCRGTTDRPGGLCPDCQRKAEAQKAQSWKWRGWSRHEERDQATGKHHRQGGK
jgi:hypothetical protein